MDEGSSNTCIRINAEHCIKCQDPCLTNDSDTTRIADYHGLQ